MKPIDKLLTRIAREHLGFETLKTRNRDSLDFRDVSAEGVRRALQAAYDDGTLTAALPIVVVTVRGGVIEDIAATIRAKLLIEDWDALDPGTGTRPTRNAWQFDARLTGCRAEQFLRLLAEV